MKLGLLFLPLVLAACATAVIETSDNTEPKPDTPKKDAAAGTDAKPPFMGPDAAMETDGRMETPDAGSNCMLKIGYGSNGCQTCMQACCNEDNACANDQDCVAVINCLNACQPNDSPCVSSCMNQHPQGANLLAAISQCMQSQCSGSCP